MSREAGRILLALGWLGAAVMPVDAQARLPQSRLQDYQATYQLLVADSDREIGQYLVALAYQPEQQRYRLSAKIQFSYSMLFKTERYHYVDEVFYRADDDYDFTMTEQHNDQQRQRVGKPDAQRGGLMIDTRLNGSPQATEFIATADYDYSLFALRFPRPCSPQQVGTRLHSRLLNPSSGDIDTVESEYVSFGSALPPTFSTAVDNICLIVTRSQRPEMNKRSWVTQEGYLLFEESPVYRLRLVTDASTLPPQPQGVHQ